MSDLSKFQASLEEVQRVLANLEDQNDPKLQVEIDKCNSQIEKLKQLINNLS